MHSSTVAECRVSINRLDKTFCLDFETHNSTTNGNETKSWETMEFNEKKTEDSVCLEATFSNDVNNMFSLTPAPFCCKAAFEATVDDGTAALTIVGTDGKKMKRCKAKKTELPNKRRRKIFAHCVDNSTTLSETPAPYYNRGAFEEKYQQEGLLNMGGFGSVYSGHRKSDRQPVAIKHIFQPNIECISMPLNGRRCNVPLEVALMAKVNARAKGPSGVVSLLDWYDLPEELILVLERPVPCLDLIDYLRSCTRSVQEQKAKIIIKQLVNVLIEIHSRGVFHRDIKLENILIETDSEAPRIWVIDFGCATFLSDGKDTTVQGTLAYTSPEWFQNRCYHAEPTTVWQIGVVMYRILHKALPFQDKFDIICNKPPINDCLSLECHNFLRSCLNKTPEERPTLEELKKHSWLG
ncbi:serine/threonine-protein kinase pim-2-like isoform X3 [Nelusetta ayraudi]|uniref:serine/threonine-protein kinase pim-2-like isoform X3 n=1 Tax=Nelusetta ayraudi TaxID=303726 RepID=UPI003F6F07DE